VSDDELMREVANGSQRAFEELFERYRGPIWRFFRRRTDDAAKAEELAQDTFVAVLEGAKRFEHRGTFRSFLFAVAYNVLAADRRKTAFRATHELTSEPPDLSRPSPEAAIWVRNALSQLDDSDREILMLREYEQLSYQEIADARGTPVNTVRSQLFRARAALRDALGAETTTTERTSHAH